MAFPDHLLTLATLRLLTLTPLAAPTATTSTSISTSTTHAHTAPSNRFHAVKTRPLRILTELTAAYIQLLGAAAKNHAEQAGRTSANALDAREAIADYGGAVEEIQEWASECQLDRGILSSTDNLLNDAPDAERADAAAAHDLGALLKDTAYNPARRPPTQIIEYAPLTDREAAIVEAVQHNSSLLPFLPYALQQQVQQGRDDDVPSSSSSSSSTSSSLEDREASTPPPPYSEATSTALSLRKQEKLRAYDSVDSKASDDPLSFLPPFPDLDATHASLQTVIEDESGRIVKRARRALDSNINMANLSQARKNASLAWLRAIPYETSSLAEYEEGKFSVPSMRKEDGHKNGELEVDEDEDEDDSITYSSLPYFLETFNWVSLDYEQQGDQALLPLPHNTKRKRAATAIHSNILNPSDDSLSGGIPALPPRHAKKQAGWIPYPLVNPDISDPSEPGGKAIRPFPFQLHPFSTQLPNSITEPVPQLVLPHSMKVLAPPMHPRYPTASTSVRTLLESASPALFSRTTRMGPPGPLLETGAAGFYQVEQEKPIIPGWPGEVMPRMMGWNFDWEIGNELEDGVKERKAAGIQDMAVHSDHRHSTLINGQNDKDDEHQPNTEGNNLSNTAVDGGITGMSVDTVKKEEYTGPNFPSLPT